MVLLMRTMFVTLLGHLKLNWHPGFVDVLHLLMGYYSC
jgi:hypothetical protein